MADLIFINGEQFHQIENFSDYYISRNGKIYNNRLDKLMRKNILKDTGYYAVNMKNDSGEYITKKVHRLLMEAFVENPENKKCINHKNGIKIDNSLDNLEWCTYSDNLFHAWQTGLRRR